MQAGGHANAKRYLGSNWLFICPSTDTVGAKDFLSHIRSSP
jgi:hypothetical protein